MGGALGKKNPLWALVPVRLHGSGKSSHLSAALRRGHCRVVNGRSGVCGGGSGGVVWGQPGGGAEPPEAPGQVGSAAAAAAASTGVAARASQTTSSVQAGESASKN